MEGNTKVLNSNIGESFVELYGISLADKLGVGFDTHLEITTTNGGNDDISKAEYDALIDIFWAAQGYEFSIENGHFTITI